MYSFFIILSLFLMKSCQLGSEPNTIASGKMVEVTSEKNIYAENEKIVIKINNNLENPVVAPNQQTYCSTVLLERQEKTNWQPIKNCTLNSPSQDIKINPGSILLVDLDPSQPVYSRLAAGNYRATFIYSMGEHFLPGQSLTVSTAIFTVR